MSTFQKQALEAAGWTFVETFLAVFSAGLVGITIGDWSAIGTLAGTSAIAALSAVFSYLKSNGVRNIGATESTLISGD